MTTQLSLFDGPIPKAPRKYFRDRVGRFATREQAELDRLKREVEFYKYKFEAEQRKTAPILKALIEAQREIHLLKKR